MNLVIAGGKIADYHVVVLQCGHATILEMNVESYRRKAALKRKRGPAD